ncbi:MAG: hypothetical protein ACYCWN_11275 [Ferrimicrobium sp.]
MPRWMVLAPLLYIVVLISVAVGLRASSGTSINLVGLSVPAAVLWFGALGGVVSSLQGMFFHNAKWDPSYNLWHWFSGAIGASYGMASYLFLIVIAKAAVNGTVAASADVFALGAFALGYGQSQFHEMMRQVFSILFHTSKTPGADASKGPNPPTPPPTDC